MEVEQALEEKRSEVESLRQEKAEFDRRLEEETRTLREEIEQKEDKIVEISAKEDMVEMYKKRCDKMQKQISGFREVEIERDQLKDRLNLIELQGRGEKKADKMAEYYKEEKDKVL